jgi:hypothetical protein
MDTTTPYRDTTTGQDLQQTGAEQVLWDLRELYPGADSPEFRRDLEELLPHAEQFARRWRGRIQELDPERLTELLQEYEQILERAARLHSYVYLNWSVESHLPQWGALLQRGARGGSPGGPDAGVCGAGMDRLSGGDCRTASAGAVAQALALLVVAPAPVPPPICSVSRRNRCCA